MVRLNAGSGQRPHGFGWVNLDIQPKWAGAAREKGGDFVCCDMARMPFPSASAVMVVANQTLEHCGCGDGKPFIAEAYRVLRPDGSLIVTVPHMRELARAWLAGRMPNGDAMTDYLFFVNTYGAYISDNADRHKWGFSPESLRDLLAYSAPWRQIKPFDWRRIPEGDVPRDWWILSAEAVK